MFIKICGITRREDYEFIHGRNISAVGFIAYPKSKRYISPENVKAILRGGNDILKVAVCVDSEIEEIKKYIAAGINVVQLHGNEKASLAEELSKYVEVWRALRPKTEKDITDNLEYPASKILIDTYSEKMMGGTGMKADWGLARLAVKLFKKPVILEGGLNLSNIENAIAEVRPFGVDINSGVETAPGIKDTKAIENIVILARKAFNNL
jgi:phosphoribosylanthranilate isomerase